MGWRIIKQPNDLFARFSEIVDDFTDLDMTAQDVIELCKAEYGLSSDASQGKLQRAIDNPQRWFEALEIIKDVHGEDKANERKQGIISEASKNNENKAISMVKDAFASMNNRKDTAMSNRSNEAQCPQCGSNLNNSWHDSVHEMWEVSQQNAWEYEREQRKRALSPSNSKDNRIQYILKLCLESGDIRHKQWGLWKIGEILDIDTSDVDADSGREP